jgi:hypothetical protein
MSVRDRRLGFRIPLEMFLNKYVKDRPFRALTTNVSDTGIHLNLVRGAPLCRDTRVVGLEFELPGTGEIIWARGEICYDALDDYFHGTGVRFTAMPRLHAHMLREFCVERRRAQLGAMLQRIRGVRLTTAVSA